ncbi:MAG: hypothetical protein WCK67_10720 [bacterium]
MLNLNTQQRTIMSQRNQVAMQGKPEKKYQTRPLEDIMFDKPVQKAKHVAVQTGEVAFILGTLSTFANIKLFRNEQQNLFTPVAEKTVEAATAKVSTPIKEQVQGVIKKISETKFGDVKKAVVDFVKSPKIKEMAQSVGIHAMDAGVSLVNGAYHSVKYAFIAGTAYLGIGALVKFADNQAKLNERLKATEE